eukprot:7253403-Prymnesium_polylepis.1
MHSIPAICAVQSPRRRTSRMCRCAGRGGGVRPARQQRGTSAARAGDLPTVSIPVKVRAYFLTCCTPSANDQPPKADTDVKCTALCPLTC